MPPTNALLPVFAGQILYGPAFHDIEPPTGRNRHPVWHSYDKLQIMINQYEIAGFIAGKLPLIKNDLQNCRSGNVYQPIQVLTDYTKRMAIGHDFKMVGKCMALVDKIYEKGDTLVRNAIENVFIFSFSSIMVLYNIIEWRIVQSYMPARLYALYMQQVLR